MTKDIVLEVGESEISFITWKSTWNMASFERGKEIEKDVFRHECETKKNTESP